MDLKLYTKLLKHRSHSRTEAQIKFRDWLKEYIEDKWEVKTQIDAYGNLYVEKHTSLSTPKYVNCVIAHLDINQSTKTEDYYVVRQGDWIVGINNYNGQQIGLGHDDKIGVYFALKALEHFDNIKCFFPLDEEVGLIGTSNADFKFWENVGFNVQLDRRGAKDVSESTNGYTVLSEDFKKEIKQLMFLHKMQFAQCICTDVGEVVGQTGIQGCNISCGYMNEHSDKEVLNVSWYKNSEEFALKLLEHTNGKRYEIQNVSKYYGYGSYSRKNRNKSKQNEYFEDYEDYWYWEQEDYKTELDDVETWYWNNGSMYNDVYRTDREAEDFYTRLKSFLIGNRDISDVDLIHYFETMEVELAELINDWGYEILKPLKEDISDFRKKLEKVYID